MCRGDLDAGDLGRRSPGYPGRDGRLDGGPGRGRRPLLHTDGATEIRNESGEMFGDERLVAEFERLANEPARDIVALLSATVLAWGKAEDDVTFLAFRYTGA